MGRVKIGIAGLFSFLGAASPSAQVADPSDSSILLGPVYNAVGEEISSTDLLGNVTSYTYNALGEETSMTQPAASGSGSGGVTYYGYDADGELTSVTDPLGNVTTYGYDNLSRETSVSLPNASTGAAGGPTTSYGYDLDGELTSETDPLGNETIYAYDDAGDLTSLTDPDGNTTSYAYDGDGQVVSESRDVYENSTATDAAVSESMAYDLDGNLTQLVDYDGRVTNYSYNSLNEETQDTQNETFRRAMRMETEEPVFCHVWSTSGPQFRYGRRARNCGLGAAG